MFYGLSTHDARQLAYEMAEVNDIMMPQSRKINRCAGLEWFRSFMRRHPTLSIRTPEGCSLSRATSFNRHNVGMFYTNLETILHRTAAFADGTRIYNLDVTATTTVQKPKRVIAGKGIKQVCQSTSAERGTLVTTCCIISASGNHLPPAMVFPRVNFRNHMIKGAPAGTLGLAGKTGWMTVELFYQVMEHFIKHSHSSPQNPSLLIFDNHESHLSFKTSSMAKEHGVTVLTIPPHCSHRIQPLDVSVYYPFSKYYDDAINSWMISNPGKLISIYEVASCVNSAHERALTPANIISGFRKTGIYPFDRNIFSDDDFMSSAVTDRPDPGKVKCLP